MAGKIVRRQGKELYVDLEQAAPEKAQFLRQIAARSAPADEISLDEMGAYMEKHYYEITRPCPSLRLSFTTIRTAIIRTGRAPRRMRRRQRR